MGRDSETHSETLCRERETEREKESLNLRLPSNPSHQRSGTQKSHERGGGKIVSIREDGENQDSTGL